LNSVRREESNHGNKIFCRTIPIFHERVGDSGFVGEVARAIRKKRRHGISLRERLHKALLRHGEQGFAGARAHHFIVVSGENRENLSAIGRGQV
jgi:hypothetical protein